MMDGEVRDVVVNVANRLRGLQLTGAEADYLHTMIALGDRSDTPSKWRRVED